MFGLIVFRSKIENSFYYCYKWIKKVAHDNFKRLNKVTIFMTIVGKLIRDR